jgi:biopolymer transport protein ExbD
MGSRASLQKDGGDEILSEINVIPLVDISLVLLIIFMVTANYIMTSSFTVDIAEAAHAGTIQQTDIITISIPREGPLYLEDRPVTSNELKIRMQMKYRDNPNISVVLSVDKNVNFKNVVRILDLLSELGMRRVNIAAMPEQ